MKIPIPTTNNENVDIQLKLGESSILIGANGAGKTRLSVYLQNQLSQIQNNSLIIKQNKIYEMEVKKWENKKEEEIEKEFNQYKKTFDIKTEKGEKQILSFYEKVELSLYKGEITLFGSQAYSPKTIKLSLNCLREGNIGILNHQDRDLRDIDVDLLKFSDKFFKEGRSVIHEYREHKINLERKKIESNKNSLKNYKIEKICRVSAHRQLTLNTKLPSQDFNDSKQKLEASLRESSKRVTNIQNDFDHLISALYSQEAEIDAKYVQSTRRGENPKEPPTTSLSQLIDFWNDILPERMLKLEGLRLTVSNQHSNSDSHYDPSEMSDGERNIFYMLGQCLIAPEKSLLIIDEPELHIHKAIMYKFWSYIKEKRKDCCFLFITHDIDFIVSNTDAEKYFIQKYEHPDKWEIKNLNPQDNILEELRIKVLGSRNPVIFVEGENGSLDIQIYQKAYNDFLIIPVGSCEQVKSNVKNFNTSSEYHHLKCYGIIDKDKLDDAQVRELKKDNIYTLEVSELENIFLSEEVVEKLFDSEYSKNEIFSKTKYIDWIFEFVKEHKNQDILENVKTQMRSKTQDVINQYQSGKINFSEIDAKQIKRLLKKK